MHYSYELDKVYVAEGTSVRYLNSGTWTSINDGQTDNILTTFATIEGKTYICNGTDDLAYTTATDWTEITEGDDW